MGVGSYCWDNLCADMPGVPAKESLTVKRGDVVSVAIPAEITDVKDAGANIFGADRPITLPDGSQVWSNSGDEMPTMPYRLAGDAVEVTIDAEPGRYVLVVGLYFDGGDVQYGVLVEVR
jgi:hypothetical protein